MQNDLVKSKSFRGYLRLGLCILLLISFIVTTDSLQAQVKSRVTGTVVDKDKQSGLIGANVSIVGTTLGAATDAQGQFLIGNVPPGTYTVLVRYIGYENAEQSVQVTAGQDATVNFEMKSSVLEMEGVAVTGERLLQSQKAALNAQYEASNIKNVVSSDLMGSFPDEEAVEAVSRIPGVVVDGEEAIMRGLPADWALTTVNGQKIPAVNAAEDRHASLQTFPIDLIQAIEVSKGQTADMDADAIAGNINFILKDAPGSQMVTAKLYQGWSSGDNTSGYPINQFDFFGPTKASLTIGDVFYDGKFGYSISGTYERETISEYTDRFAWEFDDGTWEDTENVEDLAGNPTPQGLRYHSRRPTETSESRAGFNTALLWRPSLGNKMSLRTFYSNYNLTDYDLELEENYEDAELQKLNDVKHEPKHVMNIALGGEHMVLGDVGIDYTVSYTSGRGGESHDFQGNFVTDFDDYREGDPNYYFDNNNFEVETFKEDEIITAFNLKKPFFTNSFNGYFKAGFKYKTKDRYNQKLDSDISSFDEDLTDEALADLAEDGIPYPKPWTVTRDQDFIIEYDPPLNMVFFSESSTDIDENYLANENILAAYAMAEVWLGNKFMVLPGLRMEKTSTSTESRLVDTFRRDNPEMAEAQSSIDATGKYTDLFPSLHLRYKLPKDINARFSYSKGIARPSFRYFVEFNDYDIEDKELFTGNKELKPTRSANFDILLEHYSPMLASHMSVGFFYKKIDDVIQAVFFSPSSGVYHGYEVDRVEQPQNVGTGTAQGIELSLQRQLDFLGLPQVGILANWTHQLDTYLKDPDGAKRSLPQQAEDVFNFALSYESVRLGFSGRISYQHKSKIFMELGDYSEEWDDAENGLDISLRKNLNENVRLFLKGKNLLGEDEITRLKSLRPDYSGNPIYSRFYRGAEIYGGFEFNL
jgi:outer membrane receptor for ferrienterochelin and colicin